MSMEWYYRSTSAVVGPLGAAELRRHTLDGNVEPDTPVRRGQDRQWVRAARVKGLFPASRISRESAVEIAHRLAADTPWAGPIAGVGNVVTRDGGETWVVHLVPEPVECSPGVIACDTPGTLAVCVNSETATGKWCEML